MRLKQQFKKMRKIEKWRVSMQMNNSLSNIWSGIQKTRRVMGGKACIRKTRILVWLLISYRRQGASKAHIKCSRFGECF